MRRISVQLLPAALDIVAEPHRGECSASQRHCVVEELAFKVVVERRWEERRGGGTQERILTGDVPIVPHKAPVKLPWAGESVIVNW